MVKSFRNFFLLIIIVIMTIILNGCKKEDTVSGVYKMYTVNFYTDNEIYFTDYVFSGVPVNKPVDPVRIINGVEQEGYKFLYWSYEGLKYDFSTPIEEAINLYANYEECVTLPLVNTMEDNKIGDHIFTANVELIEVSVLRNANDIDSNPIYSCYFYLQNSKTYDITFNFSLLCNAEIIDYLQFNFRKVISNFDISNISFSSIHLIKNNSITIPAGSSVMYSIDWKVDSEIVSTLTNYKLMSSIKIDNFKRAV